MAAKRPLSTLVVLAARPASNRWTTCCWRPIFSVVPKRAWAWLPVSHHLRLQVRGKILLVWDWLGVHRCRLVRQWLAAQGDQFLVEELPAYAPELNPVEYLWGWWKENTVAKGCPLTTEKLHWLACQGFCQARQRKTTLVAAFWKQADLLF